MVRQARYILDKGPLSLFERSKRHGQETRRYIQDFIRLKDQTATAQELYDRMLALYPDRINLSVSVAKGDSEPGWAASYWIVSLRTARPGKGMSLVQSD
jgi:hypothetical protein